MKNQNVRRCGFLGGAVIVVVVTLGVVGLQPIAAQSAGARASGNHGTTLAVYSDLPTVSGTLNFTVSVDGTPVQNAPGPIPLGPYDLPTVTAQLTTASTSTVAGSVSVGACPTVPGFAKVSGQFISFTVSASNVYFSGSLQIANGNNTPTTVPVGPIGPLNQGQSVGIPACIYSN